MTYHLDPYNNWETEWERQNPEPYPFPTMKSMAYACACWRPAEIAKRVQWHKARWEAFKQKFPDWRISMYGIANR